jgi:hypothetical protein
VSSIFVIWDGGYSDRGVEGAFTSREKAEAFMRRFPSYYAETDIEEVQLDAFDDADWPPGRSCIITVRPAPPPRPEGAPYSWSPTGYRPLDVEACVLRPDQCTREWESFDYGGVTAWRARFWGTVEEQKVFCEAKLVEEREKLPPGALGQSYVRYAGTKL